MALWIGFALMTTAAALFALWPLSRHLNASATASDLDVYRQQLDELESERALGRIGTAEADAARIELSRRLIAASEAKEAAIVEHKGPRRLAALATLIVIPAVALVLYGRNGSPEAPAMPLQPRLERAQENKDMPAMLAKVEAHLKQNPDDLKGWELVAPIYTRAGQLDEALNARRQIIRIAGPNAERHTTVGELLVMINDGGVNADALAAFEAALKLEPKNAKAMFFVGLGKVQAGDKDGALALWRDIIASSPPDAPWVQFVKAQIASLDGSPPPPAAAGPDSAAGRQLQQMAPADQQAAIRSMVDGLAQKLAADGSDMQGWLRLIRAYSVLGDKEKAQTALKDAKTALTGRADALAAIDALASDLKLTP